ncbi:MAG: nucleotidyltransferase domain-containing protein [Solirubrobacterales bacterium]|nr:nucleotidyltransferase domain-containing protein [Solirubrobacterales bacterium]
MDLARPLLVATPTLDGDVLEVLAGADVEFSGRELARQVGRGSVEGIRRAADRLVGQGIVLCRPAGSAHLYRLNREHLAAPSIEGLACMREELLARLRALISAWELQPCVALLFGSAARGEARAASDLDVLVIRPAGHEPDSSPWQDQLLALQRSASAWTGNDTRVLEYGEGEVAAASSERVLEEALHDGVELFGKRRVLRRLISA